MLLLCVLEKKLLKWRAVVRSCKNFLLRAVEGPRSCKKEIRGNVGKERFDTGLYLAAHLTTNPETLRRDNKKSSRHDQSRITHEEVKQLNYETRLEGCLWRSYGQKWTSGCVNNFVWNKHRPLYVLPGDGYVYPPKHVGMTLIVWYWHIPVQ
jgi:hypothetical protein